MAEKPESGLKLKEGAKKGDAWFFAPEAPGLCLTVKPMVEKFIGPHQGFMIDQKSGEHVEFENCRYHTGEMRLIKWLIAHDMFEVDFWPDASDPTGFWKAAGYFDEVSEKKLTRAKREENVVKEAKAAAEVAVTSIRTADPVASK